MRILLLGAGGFIGRHVLAELVARGHDVVGVARDISNLVEAFPVTRFVGMDLARATAESDWEPHVKGIDVIVNAAGVLRGKNMVAVHVEMPRALHWAAARASVGRSVLISAISARSDVATDYAQSKLAGEDLLRNSNIAWTILRPSLVYGAGSYGGTSLLRGMAGLPLYVPVPGHGGYLFTPVHVDDLARTVRVSCEQESFARITLEPVGPETIDLKALLGRYRTWLGFGTAHFLFVPMPIMWLLGRLGDIAGIGSICTNSVAQLIAGNAGDSAAFASTIGFVPRSLQIALRANPAEVQDRWHARLYFLAPLLTATLFLLWAASAILGLLFGKPQTQSLLRTVGLPAGLGPVLQIGSSCLDLFVAVLVLADRRAHWSTPIQVAAVFGYTLVIGSAFPHLWLDPLGSLLKNFPVLALVLVHGAVKDRR